MKKVLFIPSKFKKEENFVTLSARGVLFFSAPFVQQYDLRSCLSADLFTFPDDSYKFGVKFYKEEIEGHSKVTRALKSQNVMISAHELVSSILVLNKANKEGKQTFPIIEDKIEQCFAFSLIPGFEYSCSPNDVPTGICGIYRYKNENQEVIYIGKGSIKDRLKEAHRKDWPIVKVEYSVVENEEVRSYSEAHHIRKFESEIGRKPVFNMISGKKILNEGSAETRLVSAKF